MRSLREWWAATFPAWSDRRQLAAEWTDLGRKHRLMSDIALRGGVYGTGGQARDLYEAGILEGQRRLAVEIIRTAGTDPAILQAYCTAPRKPQE